MLSRRVLGLGLTGLALSASSSALAGQPSTAPSSDPFSVVDPELRSKARSLQNVFAKPLTHEAVIAIRKSTGAGQPLLSTPKVDQRKIAGAPGAPEVIIYVINAAEGESRPAILHIHGGGFMGGSARYVVRDCQELALAHDAVVVTVEYRLAPETPFPGPLDDCYAALSWLHRNARDLGVDASRIAVKGESAGGGLAAMLALAARDRGDVPLCAQILLYPMLDDRTGSTRKASATIPYFWTPQANVYGWTCLLGVPAGSPDVPAGAVPARVANLAGLAPTFIGVGSIDLFVDEDVTYAERLRAAGVPTELLVLPGAFHAFDAVAPQASLSKSLTIAWNEALAR
ncbi:MAG TPA: alpha/beta hydrolase, partial [Caulobacteraceae bacterium]|nr:alpha/beta hydrolase [Caulobacteraceae bacterium]